MIRTRLATLAGLVLCATLLGCSGGSDSNYDNTATNDGASATTHQPSQKITPIKPPGSELGGPKSDGSKPH